MAAVMQACIASAEGRGDARKHSTSCARISFARGKAREVRQMRVLLLLLVTGGLFACGQPGTGAGAGENAEQANRGDDLPLQRGFYVASDTACGSASTATLLLIRSGGMNGARDACDFRSIEQAGPASYRVVVACATMHGEAQELLTYRFEITDTTQFSYGTEGSDHRSYFRYCEQSSLPDPWRDNDISDLLGD